jgi:hypothetical protein
MPETPMSPEVQKMLPKAVEEVGDLYMWDLLSGIFEFQLPEQDQLWRETAQKFGPFSKKITDLRQAIKKARIIKMAYPEIVTSVEQHFYYFEDQTAREFLTDLLFARTILPDNKIYPIQVKNEAVAMATELGFGRRLQGEEEMKSVNLDEVILLVLSGELQLTRQT